MYRGIYWEVCRNLQYYSCLWENMGWSFTLWYQHETWYKSSSYHTDYKNPIWPVWKSKMAAKIQDRRHIFFGFVYICLIIIILWHYEERKLSMLSITTFMPNIRSLKWFLTKRSPKVKVIKTAQIVSKLRRKIK